MFLYFQGVSWRAERIIFFATLTRFVMYLVFGCLSLDVGNFYFFKDLCQEDTFVLEFINTLVDYRRKSVR